MIIERMLIKKISQQYRCNGRQPDIKKMTQLTIKESKGTLDIPGITYIPCRYCELGDNESKEHLDNGDL